MLKTELIKAAIFDILKVIGELVIPFLPYGIGILAYYVLRGEILDQGFMDLYGNVTIYKNYNFAFKMASTLPFIILVLEILVLKFFYKPSTDFLSIFVICNIIVYPVYWVILVIFITDTSF